MKVLVSALLILEVARFAPLLILLAVAAYQDLTKTVTVEDGKGGVFKCGEVSNKLWLYTPIGLALTVLQLYFFAPLTVLSVLSVGMSCLAAIVLFVFRGWGGADAKAFMMIAVSMPLMPFWSGLFPVPLPFTVLFVSCLGAVVYGLLQRSTVPFARRRVRFLPFIFAGLVVAFLI